MNRPPFVQVTAPLAWTTLALTIHCDGRSEYEVVGTSPFPRHWIYDGRGDLVAKVGVVDFGRWSREHFADGSPWSHATLDHPVVTSVESALERQLSSQIMRGGTKPKIRRVRSGDTLVEQGEAGEELFLLLDGILAVEVDGESLVELGPGVVIGERALLEDGRRTATLRAVTAAKVAVVAAGEIEPGILADLARGHRREDDRAT